MSNYEAQFKQLSRYKKMPQMIPWVGTQFGQKCKKTLFVGESHYLTHSSQIQKNVDQWYESTIANLSPAEVSMTSTAEIVGKNYAHNTIWANPARVIKDVFPHLTTETGNVYDHFAFYNFFPRPAEKQGKGIKYKKRDRDLANELCVQIFEILQPDAMIFLSSAARQACNRKLFPDNLIVEYAPHPARPWWNTVAKKYGNKTGKEKFRWILENKIK